jgi:hypothetical protein
VLSDTAKYDTLEVAEIVDLGRGLEKADSAEQSFELLLGFRESICNEAGLDKLTQRK